MTANPRWRIIRRSCTSRQFRPAAPVPRPGPAAGPAPVDDRLRRRQGHPPGSAPADGELAKDRAGQPRGCQLGADARHQPGRHPYRYGGNTPDSGFDCSGLVAYVYREMLDLRLPRTSRDLAAVQGPKIDPQRLATGDLVFFGSRGSVTHVGIYVGEGRFVHAPSTGGTVRLDSLSGPYWKDHYTGAKRVLR
jgi:cell wall-associated NlpC family hydrolase